MFTWMTSLMSLMLVRSLAWWQGKQLWAQPRSSSLLLINGESWINSSLPLVDSAAGQVPPRAQGFHPGDKLHWHPSTRSWSCCLVIVVIWYINHFLNSWSICGSNTAATRLRRKNPCYQYTLVLLQILIQKVFITIHLILPIRSSFEVSQTIIQHKLTLLWC